MKSTAAFSGYNPHSFAPKPIPAFTGSEFMPRMSASQIKVQLDELIAQAELVEPDLANRIREFKRWIVKKKDGLLDSKPYVLDLLQEIIQDSRFWLIIKPLSSIERLELYQENNISLAKQYWFDVLFPTWLHERDPQSPIWKQKIMAGEFRNTDGATITQMERAIMAQQGSVVRRYILDLSMATDLLIAGNQQPLCVQLTSLAGQWLPEKVEKWQKILMDWRILRGLMLSYAMVNTDYRSLAEVALQHSDSLAPGSYTVVKM
jgi:hypothetical protein